MEYNSIRQSLDKLGYPRKIMEVRTQVEEIGYSDETVWSIGSWYQTDPNNPEQLIPLKKSKEAAFNRAASFFIVSLLSKKS
jgi:hypothetical protein